jgi:ketosteroid isomerase-like protein
MQDELLALEREFAQAIVTNDVDAVERFLADDWVILDPDGVMIERRRQHCR